MHPKTPAAATWSWKGFIIAVARTGNCWAWAIENADATTRRRRVTFLIG
tara:strand:- start:560 stop:706 length:147 start_codon:yes stop_codon:yes gene_type:complete